MGIKNLEKELDCGYMITRDSDGIIHLANGYSPSVISINKDYEIFPSICESRADGYIAAHRKLKELQQSGKLKELMESVDEFGELTDVYTFDDGRVFKEQCEVFGWPNTTIDGNIMYENTHFLTRKEALAGSRGECKARCKHNFRYTLPDYLSTSKKIVKIIWSDIIQYIRSHLFRGY